MLIPNFFETIRKGHEAVQRRALARVALAAAARILRTGEPQLELAQLVPGDLPEIPIDTFLRQALENLPSIRAVHRLQHRARSDGRRRAPPAAAGGRGQRRSDLAIPLPRAVALGLTESWRRLQRSTHSFFEQERSKAVTKIST